MSKLLKKNVFNIHNFLNYTGINKPFLFIVGPLNTISTLDRHRLHYHIISLTYIILIVIITVAKKHVLIKRCCKHLKETAVQSGDYSKQMKGTK